MSEDDRRRWDARHESADPAVADAPRMPRTFTPFQDEFPVEGRALDIACGRGEASVWLAGRGMTVVGIDVSPVAIDRARQLASSRGVDDRCEFQVVDLDSGLSGRELFDVVLCHMFRGNGLERAMVDALAPGGLLAVAWLSEVGGKPGRFHAQPGELREAFSQFNPLDILEAGEGNGRAWLLARSHRKKR